VSLRLEFFSWKGKFCHKKLAENNRVAELSTNCIQKFIEMRDNGIQETLRKRQNFTNQLSLIKNHAIENTVATKINATYARRMMERCHIDEYTAAFLDYDWL